MSAISKNYSANRRTIDTRGFIPDKFGLDMLTTGTANNFEDPHIIMEDQIFSNICVIHTRQQPHNEYGMTSEKLNSGLSKEIFAYGIGLSVD